MRDIVYLDGQFVERENARVSIEDRGYQFADGVYEVTKYFGSQPLRLDEHLARIERSAGQLRIAGAPTADQWREIAGELLNRCEISDDDDTVYGLYQQVTRGVTPRNHVFPSEPVKPTVLAYFRKVKLQPEEKRASGVELSTQPDERWNRCYIKSICLLPVILAKQAAIEAGAFEAVLVRDGYVTEGGSTNVFCVRNGVVYTHPEGPHILSGITRKLVFEAATKSGIPLVERTMPIEEFRLADEAFITATTLDIMPATKLDGAAIGNGTVGPVTARLVETLASMIREETGKFAKA